MTRKQRRMVMIGAAMGVLSLAAALVLTALKDSIVFFNSPSDVVEKHIVPGTRLRLGGLVQPGSILRDSTNVRFEVTDGNKRFRSATLAFCRTYSEKGRASSLKVRSMRRGSSVPTQS